MVKVSVIVPVYNMEKYLEKCLDSLLNQTLEEIEIIAVDDGSKDASFDILQRYAAKSDKIKCFRKENGGVSDARNFGLPHAVGEYIGYVDSDDFVDSDMYEVMYNKAKEQDYDIVECNLHHTYSNYEDTEIVTKYYKVEELLCFGRQIVWNKIFRRQWLLDTRVTFPVGIIYEDGSFCYKLAPYIKSYAYVDIAPVHYVQRSGSLNNNNSKLTMQIFEMLQDLVVFYKENGFYERYKQELEYLHARILLCSSFARMCRIPDKGVRKEALKLNLQELEEAYPDWRKNPILKKEKNKYALFMRTVNVVTYRVYSVVFPVTYRMSRRFSLKWK